MTFDLNAIKSSDIFFFKVLFLKLVNIPVIIITFLFFMTSKFKFVALIAILRDLIFNVCFL